jgi:hypothetical protein
MKKKQLKHNVLLNKIKLALALTLLISLLAFVAFNTKKYYERAIYDGDYAAKKQQQQQQTIKLARIIFELANRSNSKASTNDRFNSQRAIDDEWFSIKSELEETVRLSNRLAARLDDDQYEAEESEFNTQFQIESKSNSNNNNSNSSARNSNKKRCPKVPPLLNGRVLINSLPTPFDAFEENVTHEYGKRLSLGGRYEPEECIARHRVAIVVPYKNRLNNLNYFLNHMHPFLQKQQLAYQIVVVEQHNENLFNKGVLMNAGFLELIGSYENKELLANKTNYSAMPFDCVVFHDVDLLPEDDRIMYSCPKYRPRHLSVAIDKFRYRMAYFKLVGKEAFTCLSKLYYTI